MEATRQERRDAAENRQRILQAARQLFTMQGVDATSMNQIAHAAGVGPGTLYRNYAHKGEVCMALLDHDLTDFQERMNALIEDSGGQASALALLDRFLEALLMMIESHIRLFAGMQDSFAGERRHDVFQTPFYTWMHASIMRILSLAVQQNETSNIDIACLADMLFAVVAPPLVAFQQEQRSFDHERIIACIRRVFIEGLRVPA